MSVLKKEWKLLNTDKKKTVIEKVRQNRGLTEPDDLTQFINPNFKKDFHDPFLLKGMLKAVERIEKAIKDNERIIVYGDYDVDGISGAAILVITLQHMGGNVSYRLPHRVTDGYGLNSKYIDEFADINVGLLITVDCGISNADEIALAKEKGIDVIVTDHHTVPEKYPDAAYEVIHPFRPGCDYPFKHLTGAGVAFKVAHALLQRGGHEEEDDHSIIYAMLDLASLGTVADCAPIIGENRLIVKKGIEMLPRTKWEGLKFLQELAGVDFSKGLNTYTIGFQIAPRINAAGRIDSPYHALHLLIQNGETKKVKNLAAILERLNKKRQVMLQEALEEAEKKIKLQADNKIIVESDPHWHVGIIGLIAGRLTEKYAKPSIIMQDFGDYLVASARSPEYFNVIEVISKYSHLLDHFGGHAQAAGFNIKKKNLAEFRKKITEYANKQLAKLEPKPMLSIDCEINPEEINEETADFMDSLEPFGIANERPKFLLKEAVIESVSAVGKDRNHVSLNVDCGNRKYRGIAFNMGEHIDLIRRHRSLNLVFQIEINNWKGRKTVQLKIVDFAKK